MIKVLLIQNYITNYNLPIYNLLAEVEDIQLTLAHFGKSNANPRKSFSELTLTNRKFGPFYISKGNIFSICQKFDVVISMGDIHWLSLMLLSKKNRKFKLIYWGIGVSASYKNKFDENKRWDFLRYFLLRRADALLFYSSYPLEKYSNNGVAWEKMFVANNTVPVLASSSVNMSRKKDSILFIGSLYAEKGLFELLDAYNVAYLNSGGNLPILNVIGEGNQFDLIQTRINDMNLRNRICLLGAIYDETVLETYFARAYACISPNQAGLSVLKSMGYGVPFVTKFDSITGGERFNIVNGETGLLYHDQIELVNILQDTYHHATRFIEMGRKAKEFYNEFRLPQHMVRGFLDAIYFVIKK